MAKNNTRTHDTVSDFCILNGRNDARLSDVERLTMLGGGALERVLSKLGRNLDNVRLDTFAPGLDPQTLLEYRTKLLKLRTEGALRELLAAPTATVEPHVVPIHGFPNGRVVDLAFDSHFPASNWQHDCDYQLIEENQISHVRLWEHTDRSEPRPTIVAIHGWTMGDQRVNSLAFLPGLYFSLGCNVALVELPFHGRRMPSNALDGMPLFPSADPIRTCVGTAHALHDLRSLSAFLERQGHSQICCIGMSLGAYVGALWSALDNLHRTVLVVPLVSMGDMAWELLKRKYSDNGPIPPELSLSLLRDLFSDHNPLSFSPKTAQESIMVIRATGDHLVTRSQIALLRQGWPRAKYLWTEGGHGAATKQGDIFTRMTRFLLKGK